MYLGHSALAVWFKSIDGRMHAPLPLWLLLLVAHAPDLLLFFLTGPQGIEHVDVDFNKRGWTRMSLLHVPISHGILSNLIFALVFVCVGFVGSLRNGEGSAGRRPYFRADCIRLGCLYFSHILCDILVHCSDLPLYDSESPKIGLGLWAYQGVSTILELCMLGYSWFLFESQKMKNVHANLHWQIRIFPVVLALLQILMEISLNTTPGPHAQGLIKRPRVFSIMLFSSGITYLVVAALAWALVDRQLDEKANTDMQ